MEITDTQVVQVLRGQYHAGLSMLQQVVTRCPAEMWDDECDKNRFWRVAYHALFFTHLYLHESGETFAAWDMHHEDYEMLGRRPWPPHDLPIIGEPYTREEVLAFLQVCWDLVDELVPRLHLEGASGFSWLPHNKLELQFYNLRHLQQHTGELMERLGSRAQIDVDWIGSIAPLP
jgi:hypothetical protein